MEKTVKTGFFRALSGCCRGTAIFFELKEQKLWRACLHGVLLLLLCALALTGIKGVTGSRIFDQAADNFRTAFGGIAVGGKGKTVVPVMSPDTERAMLLPNGGIMLYCPGVKSPELPAQTNYFDFNYLIYWFPDNFVVCRKFSGDELIAAVFNAGNILASQHQLNSKGMDKLLAKLTPEKLYKASDVKTENIPADKLAPLGKSLYLMLSFYSFLIFDGLLTVFYIAVFVGMFKLTGGANLRQFTFKSLLVCAIYAGFPAMMIATLFPAFDLPLLNFGSAYVIGMVMLLLSVVGVIERSGNAGQKGE